MVDISRIKNYKIFQGLTLEEIEKFVFFGTEMSYKKDDVLMEESTAGVDLFILLDGRASVELKIPPTDSGLEERRRNLAILREGAIIGEISFLEGMHRSARIIAIDDIQVLKMERDRLYELFESNTRIGYLIMRNIAIIVAHRLVNLNFRVRDNM